MILWVSKHYLARCLLLDIWSSGFFICKFIHPHLLGLVLALFNTFSFCFIPSLWIVHIWNGVQNTFEVDWKFTGKLSFLNCFGFLFEEVYCLSWFGWITKFIILKSILGSWINCSISLAISGSTSIRLSPNSWLSVALNFWDFSIRLYISCGYKDHISLWKTLCQAIDHPGNLACIM